MKIGGNHITPNLLNNKITTPPLSPSPSPSPSHPFNFQNEINLYDNEYAEMYAKTATVQAVDFCAIFYVISVHRL